MVEHLIGWRVKKWGTLELEEDKWKIKESGDSVLRVKSGELGFLSSSPLYI